MQGCKSASIQSEWKSMHIRLWMRTGHLAGMMCAARGQACDDCFDRGEYHAMNPCARFKFLCIALLTTVCLMGCQAVKAQQSGPSVSTGAEASSQGVAARGRTARPTVGSGGASSWMGASRYFKAGVGSFGGVNSSTWRAGARAFGSPRGTSSVPGPLGPSSMRETNSMTRQMAVGSVPGISSATGTGISAPAQGTVLAVGPGAFAAAQPASWVAGQRSFGLSLQEGGIWVAHPGSRAMVRPSAGGTSAVSSGGSLFTSPTLFSLPPLSSARAAGLRRPSFQGARFGFAGGSGGSLPGPFGAEPFGGGFQGQHIRHGPMSSRMGYETNFHTRSAKSRLATQWGLKSSRSHTGAKGTLNGAFGSQSDAPGNQNGTLESQ